MKINNKKLLFFEYAAIFICIFTTYFFIIPRTDDFLFALENSCFDFVINYGNGRVLGNLFLWIMSHNFVFANLFIALIITLSTYITDKIFFNRNLLTPLIIAIFYSFPSSNLISDCYYWVPAFVNYVMPIVFIALSLYILKSINDSEKYKTLKFFFLFLSTFLSCFFSENTSVIIVAMSTLFLIEKIIKKERFSSAVLLLSSSAVGTVIMLLLPTLTNNAHKLDEYRSLVEFSFHSIITNTVTFFLMYLDTICKSTFLVSLISFVLICYLYKKTDMKLKVLFSSILFLYPLFSIFINCFNSDFAQARYIIAVPTLIYFATVLVCLIKIKSLFQNYAVSSFITAVFSPVPMFIIEVQSSYRTLYITYFFLVVFTCNLLRIFIKDFEIKSVKAATDNSVYKAATACCMVLLISISGYIFIQSVYNFNYFAARTEYIKSAIAASEDSVEVIDYPCNKIYSDKGLAKEIQFMFPSVTPDKVEYVTYDEYNKTNSTYTDLPSNPVGALKYAVSHIKYKSTDQIK